MKNTQNQHVEYLLIANHERKAPERKITMPITEHSQSLKTRNKLSVMTFQHLLPFYFLEVMERKLLQENLINFHAYSHMHEKSRSQNLSKEVSVPEMQ